jgi:hypothetical protein
MQQQDLLKKELTVTLMLERSRPLSLTEFEKVMSDVLDDAIVQIAKSKSPMTLTRSREIVSSIKELLTPIYGDFPEWILIDEELAFELSYNASAGALATAPLAIKNDITAVSFNKINKTQIETLLRPNRQLGSTGFTLETLLRDLENNQVKRIRHALTKGVVAKQTHSQITANIQDIFKDITKNKADAVVRTAIQDSADVARQEVYKQFDSVINGYISTAVLDDRTTPICVSLHLKKYMKNKGESVTSLYNRIPNKPKRHLRCRSLLTPITDNTNELLESGTRPTVEGKGKDRTVRQIRADATFSEFFSTLSHKGQATLVGGETKARLVRENKLSLKQILKKQKNGEVKYLTNDEIRDLIND